MTKIPFLYDFMQKFGIKCKKMNNGFRNFSMTCNARKTLWMVLHARKLETETVKYAVEPQ